MAVISGVVRDPDGEPVPEGRVYFTGGPGPLPDIAAVTGPDGHFALSTPGPGAYEIEASAEGYAPAKATVDAPEAGEAEVELRLSG